MDVKSAFLNGELKKIVYVRQPLGFLDNNNFSKVLHPSTLWALASTMSLECKARQYPVVADV